MNSSTTRDNPKVVVPRKLSPKAQHAKDMKERFDPVQAKARRKKKRLEHGTKGQQARGAALRQRLSGTTVQSKVPLPGNAN